MTIPPIYNLGMGDMPPMKETISMMRALFDPGNGTGDLTSIPRRKVAIPGNNELVFSIGSTVDVFGFRHYPAIEAQNDKQPSHITVIYRKDTGTIKTILLGETVAAWRTGAIGGIAIDRLSSLKVKTLGLLGTGLQATTQLLAALSVRQFDEVRIFSPTPENQLSFIEKISKHTGVTLLPECSAEEVVRNSDVLICATSSPTPVFKSSWLKQNVVINNVGPKLKNKHELPPGLYNSTSYLFTDAPEQANSINNLILSKEQLQKLIPLNSKAALDVKETEGRKIFVSLGLPGSEVFLADKIIDSLIKNQSQFNQYEK